MSLYSQVKPTQMQMLQKFKNTTKTDQVVNAVSRHYNNVWQASLHQNTDILSNI
jgi:hypothetical protein